MYDRTKRLLLVSALIVLCLLMVKCSAVLTPLPVGFYSGAKFPIGYDAGYTGSGDYQLLGYVEGKATATSILGLFATGDASISTAYQNAIAQYPEADCLIEIAIDYSANSILGIFASMTTIVKGKAIQFTRLESRTEKSLTQKETMKIIPSTRKDLAMEKKDVNIDTTTTKLEVPTSKIYYTHEGFITWKKMLRQAIDNRPFSKLWKDYIKRNSLNISKSDWVNNFKEEDYKQYLSSKTPFDKWIEQILKK